MFFDSWHKDFFLPLPPEDPQQYSNWIRRLLAVVVLIGTVVGVILKKRKF